MVAVVVAAALGAVWADAKDAAATAALVIMDDARSLARIVVRVKSWSSEQAGTLFRLERRAVSVNESRSNPPVAISYGPLRGTVNVHYAPVMSSWRPCYFPVTDCAGAGACV